MSKIVTIVKNNVKISEHCQNFEKHIDCQNCQQILEKISIVKIVNKVSKLSKMVNIVKTNCQKCTAPTWNGDLNLSNFFSLIDVFSYCRCSKIKLLLIVSIQGKVSLIMQDS